MRKRGRDKGEETYERRMVRDKGEQTDENRQRRTVKE